MKKIGLLSLILIGLLNVSNAQSFECRVIESDYGYLVYQMRETSGTNTPSTSTDINDITFVIRYPSGSVDMDLICSTNDYEIFDALSGEQTYSGYDYHYWNASASPAVNPPSNWTQNVWEDIALFKATSATGSGLFEVAPNGWDGRSLNWNQTVGATASDFLPTIDGSGVTYSYPTVVYDYVWTGATNSQWDNASNWLTECGSAIASAPNIGNNCIIPSGLTNYPNEVNLAQFGGHQPTCSDLKIASGASLTLDEKDVTTLDLVWTFTNITIDGVIAIIPNTRLTVTGSATVNSATGIVVQADATGVGSFIDNGTITYGASGSAKVQTYLTNSAGVGNFDIHLVGPTVDQISGGTDGALLSAFNLVNGNTYAYEWDESLGFASGWVNIYDNNYVVNSGSGIGLSTDDGSTNTLDMSGELMTGAVSSQSLTFSNNHNELLSNPYPSAIDFDGLATDNTSVVQNKYWIWNPSGNVYIARAAGSGGNQYIQVGQGFFVETKQTGTFDFTNARRAHSNASFRSTQDNILTVHASGGMEGYMDEMIVRFDEAASSGYDIEMEAMKWSSQNSDATQISSVAEDNSVLAINVLPLESLNNGMTSIPMNFSCGYNTEYQLSFYDLETFEAGTEIWLEDKLLGGDWVSINDNMDYAFTATPNDAEDRFVLHFFGPTGIDDELATNAIDIFSYRQNALVRNNTGELIKKVSIYTLGGALLQESNNAELKLNKYYVSNDIGYFVVRVITDKNVYTEKIFISN